MKRLLFALVAVLALPALASAGGWATVQLSSTPTGVRAGAVWDVRITVLQHGVTPLAGVSPAVEIRSAAKMLRYRARPTATTGVYRARVVFPSRGSWRFVVDDGFGGRHTYAAVRVVR